MKTEVITINPVMAKNILDKSKLVNRPIKKNHVEFLSYQMLQGKWELTGEPLIFNDDFGLIDGYHRMNAIIKSNTSQEFLVVKGVSKDVFSVIDTGVNRTGGDCLNIMGVKDGHKIAMIIKTYLKIKRTNVYSVPGVPLSEYKGGGASQPAYKKYATNQDVLDTYFEKPEFWVATKKKCDVWYNAYKHLMPIGLFAPLYIFFNEKTDKLADEFFNKLCYMNFDENQNDPLRKLTSVLMANATSDKKYSGKTLRAFIVKSWNAFYKKETIRNLKYLDNEPFPEILP